MDKQLIITRLAALPGEIEEAEWAVLDSHARLSDAKERLTDREAQLLLGGGIDGKNAEFRSAQLRGLTVAERQAVTEAETLLAKRRATLGKLINEFRALDAVVRLLTSIRCGATQEVA
ncbi:MAG: hypothetical protein RDU89_06850 [bacterium]|nr:hypothetical protein [bacterium]